MVEQLNDISKLKYGYGGDLIWQVNIVRPETQWSIYNQANNGLTYNC